MRYWLRICWHAFIVLAVFGLIIGVIVGERHLPWWFQVLLLFGLGLESIKDAVRADTERLEARRSNV